MVIAFLLDRQTALLLRDSGIAKAIKGHWAVEYIAKPPGTYGLAIAIAALVFIFHRPQRFSGTALVLLSGLTGLAGSIIKWSAGRFRPFTLDDHSLALPFTLHPFRGGIPGLFKQTNLAFPSGHANTAFATATALAILFPRARWLFLSIATMTAMERVAENAHWLSDSLAGAVLGIAGVHLTWRLIRNPLRHIDQVVFRHPPNPRGFEVLPPNRPDMVAAPKHPAVQQQSYRDPK
jgi:membrane-associated phospholipid phosphatase